MYVNVTGEPHIGTCCSCAYTQTLHINNHDCVGVGVRVTATAIYMSGYSVYWSHYVALYLCRSGLRKLFPQCSCRYMWKVPSSRPLPPRRRVGSRAKQVCAADRFAVVVYS